MADRDRWLDILRDSSVAAEARPRRIAESCVELLAVNGAGISMASNTGQREVVCATDDVSARIEELQVTLGEGPCIDAIGRGGPVLVGDLEDPDDLVVGRWPTFMAAASDAGVRAVFAFPLRIGVICVGALDLYRTTAGALKGHELSGALLAAEAAGVALIGLGTDAETALAAEGEAGAHLAQVHQATGMVMAQMDIPIEEAFLVLRARAFALGRPLHDVAIDVVERRLRFTEEDR